jgi:hypothetical protein
MAWVRERIRSKAYKRRAISLQNIPQFKSGSLNLLIMDESRSLNHDYPHPENNHVEFHPQVYRQLDPEQRLRSDNDPVQFIGPISTQHSLGNLETSLELGYGEDF